MNVKSLITAELISNLKISDKTAFNYYLKELWPDLIARRVRNENDKDLTQKNQNVIGLNKLIFNNYYSLPGIIGDRLFRVFDAKRKDILEFSVFKVGMNILFCDDYQNLLRFIFDFYDFDGDGKISKEDIRVVLSYVKFSNKKNNKNIKNNKDINENINVAQSLNMQQLYESSVNTQNQLIEILEKCFENRDKLINFDNFINIVEDISSEIFFLIYIFLLQNRPFSEKTIQLYKKIVNENYLTISTINSDSRKNCATESNFNITISENDIRMPTLTQSNYNYPIGKSNVSITTNDSNGSRRKRNILRKNKTGSNYYSNNVLFMEPGDIYKTLYETKLTKDIVDNMRKIDHLEKKNNLDDNNNLLDCEKNNYEGYLYKDNKGFLVKIFAKLYFKDLFFYRQKNDIKHYCMHNLSGLFFKEENKRLYENKTYLCFSIIYPNKKRIYYCENENEFQNWSKCLKIATKYSNLLEIYEIKDILGRGSFSLVKQGINKFTKEIVAVKIMDKKKMNTARLESARTEIEIMKICQHPYIIHFIDSYETADFIYIFMEYCNGGTFYKFLKNRNFILKEEVAVSLAHKICMAVYYFHSFGITHRDLKPENILMTSEDENADIKILDFGLSKIIGPNEKCSEPYGTIIYCAPEIILDYPYTKNVDSWSIGVITYIMLYGNLPFFDKNRQKLTKIITKSTPLYRGIYKVSDEAKNFVQRLLVKDQNKRMNIKEALEHKWFRKYNKEFIDYRMKNKDKKNIFQLYTSLNITNNNSNSNNNNEVK